MMTMFGMIVSFALANGPVIERGVCSDASVWDMEARRAPQNRIEVEFEVESFVAGQTWDLEIYRNGSLIGTPARTSRGADGYFWVERELRNRAGVEEVEVVAINRVTGEVCEGYIEWPF